MSSIIESIARGTKNQLSGFNTDEAVQQQQDRGNRLMKQLATGGLALGAGTSAAVALINYLKSIKEEEEILNESRLNDDTLYIPEQAKAAADVNRWVAPGLGVTAGILGAGGAYGLTQAIYNYLQKKRREKMLDQAQGETLAAADEEIAKSAKERMTFTDLVTAFPVAVPLLAAMASGGVTYAALKKTFPTVKQPKSKYPKRIRQVSSTGQVGDIPEEDMPKLAAIHGEQDCEDAAYEFLMLVTDQVAREKSASICLTSDILNRAAKDGVKGMVDTYLSGGIEALTEAVKGASDTPAEFPAKVMAAATLAKSARLAPVARMLAAAEFQDMAPGVYGAALEQGEEQLEKFAGIGALFHMTYFRPQMLEKGAAVNPMLQAELQQALATQMGPMDSMGQAGQDALNSDAAGFMADDMEGEGLAHETAEDEVIEQGNDDPVDAFMEMENKTPLVTAEEEVEEEGI